MSAAGFERLSPGQRARLAEWMPRALVVADHSWGLVDTTVLEVVDGAARFIVKAAGADGHHLGRELDAHDGFTRVWVERDAAAPLVHADRDERVLVTSYLSGDLAYSTPAAVDPGVHRRAGDLLRAFHGQTTRDGGRELERRLTVRAAAWLDGDHRIDGESDSRLRALLARLDAGDPPIVPTHGDWQPRNWLVDGERVRVIDFGRFAFRSAASDFARLAAQEWQQSPECESAFFEGYGDDPRTPEHWLLVRAREAIGTACWAYQVGDEAFEAQGHRMIAEVLGAFEG